MSVNKYRVFKKVSETLNISQAAKELNYTQSNISQIIISLEKEIKMPLIMRTNNGIVLTECGRRLLKPISEMLKWENIIDHTVSSMQAVDEGHIKVGVFSSVLLQWIPSILKEITSAHPKIEVELIQGDYFSLRNMVENNELDCAFTIDVKSKNYEFIPLYEDEYYVILPKDHVLCEYERIPIEALNTYPLIIVDEGYENYGLYSIIKNLIQLNIRYKVKEDFGAYKLVEQGLGISISPDLVYRNINNNCRIVARKFTTPQIRHLGISLYSMQWATPLTKLFIDTTKKFVKSFSSINKITPLL